MRLQELLSPRLHAAALIIVVLAQLIGIVDIPVGLGSILLLPLLFAFAFGLLTNSNIVGSTVGLLKTRHIAAASSCVVVAIIPFIAKFGTTVGPALSDIIAAGPALLLQELGNLFTIVFALPVALWVLKMGRESVGATFSVAREPSLAIVADRYGLKSPEGAGVMGVYVVGTLVGTIVFSVLASGLASTDVFDPRALAMACGVGSGSMMAACSGALAAAVPAQADTLIALAGASNLLTYATGMYASLFIALPLVEWIYRRFSPEARRGKAMT